MKINFRGTSVIIQGKNPGEDFYSDKTACEFLNHVCNYLYRIAEYQDQERNYVMARIYREEASELFDQIALTGYYGENDKIRAQEKKRR